VQMIAPSSGTAYAAPMICLAAGQHTPSAVPGGGG
jgi:hypothetical protein